MSFHGLGKAVSAALFLTLLAASAGLAQVPLSKHVVLVIDENSKYSDVKADMPWLVGEGNAHGYASNYHSDSGGSMFDYLWLASGSCHSSANCSLPSGTHDFDCTGNGCFYPGTSTTHPITDDNIFRELNKAGISWKVYAQSYAAAGGTPKTPDHGNGTDYYRRHNAAVWYSDILSNVSGSASKVVDLSHLSTDISNGALPHFSIIIPDGHHDAHNCPVGMSTCTEAEKLAAADKFLSSTLTPILNMADFQSGGTGLILVTFDECADGTDAGCNASVYTALIGPRVVPHKVSSTYYKHENALRTVLDSLGIKTYPGASASAAAMSDFFPKSANKPQVVISSPSSGASATTPITIKASATPTSGNSITGWWVYVDSVAKYNGGAITSISPSISLSTGTHSILVRAWDSSQAYGDQTINVTVTSPQPTVSILTPGNNVDVGSPVNLQASASTSGGQSITGWWIYVDGTATYNGGALNSINANVPMSAGTHSVIARAWDSSQAFGDQEITVTVSSKPAIAVSAPRVGSNVISPISIKASATPPSGRTITGWWVYLDGVAKYNAGATNSISTNIAASTGSHTIIVKAWDSSGAHGSQSFAVQVKPVAVNITTPVDGSSILSGVSISASAASTNSIVGWNIYVDSNSVYSQGSGSNLNAYVSIGPGSHSVVVRAWDSSQAHGDDTITLTVP